MSDEPSLYGLSQNITGGTQSSVCVDPVANASICEARTGWKFSPSSQVCYKVTKAECSPPNQVWSCDLFDSIDGGEDFCPQFQFFGYDNTTLLKCVYDTSQPCSDRSSCESSGSCDDEFLSDPVLPPWFPSKQSCVVPFVEADESGQPNASICVSDGAVIEWTLGCIYLQSNFDQLYRRYRKHSSTPVTNSTSENKTKSNITTVISLISPLTFDQVCLIAGGYLAGRAKNQVQCEMGSERCLRDQQFVQNIDRPECTNERICDPTTYSWQPTRTWTGGTWMTTDTIAAKWVKREWNSINEFVNTFSFDKMFQLITDSVSRKIQGAFVSYAQCTIGLYSPVFEKIATILDQNPTDDMILALQDVKQIMLVSKTVSVDLSVLHTGGRRGYNLKGLLEQAAAKNKSAGPDQNVNRSNATLSQQATSLADALLYCSSGYVRIPQRSLALAALKNSRNRSLMDTTLIQLSIASAAQFKDARLEPSTSFEVKPDPRSRMQILDTSSNCITGYAVVQNDQRVIIGQLIGNALAINAAGIDGLPVSICFNADPAIRQCIQKFPVLDVVLLDTRTNKLIVSNSLPVAINAASSSQYCANNLSAPTPDQVYFPVRRSSELYPVATVILRLTFHSVSEPSLLDRTLQILLKAAISASLPAGAKVLPRDVKITSICRADGTGCLVPYSTRRALASGVAVTTSISTANAAAVSDHSGGSAFANSFVQVWNTNASIKLSESQLVVENQGIIQPLAPIVQESSAINVNFTIESSPAIPPYISVSSTGSAIPETPTPSTSFSQGVTTICLYGALQCQSDQSIAVLASSDQYFPNSATSSNISWSSVDLQIPIGAWPSGDNRPLQVYTVDSRGTVFNSAATNQGAVFAGPITYFTPSGIVFSVPVTISIKVNGSAASSAATLGLYRYNATSGAWERTLSCSSSASPSAIYNSINVCGQTGSFSAYAPLIMPIAAGPSAGRACNDGCIAGAVIGSVLGAALLIFLAYWFVLRPDVGMKDGGISTKSAREEGRNQSQSNMERPVPTTDLSKREVRDSDTLQNLQIAKSLQTSAAHAESWPNIAASETRQGQDKIERIKAPDDVEYDV